MEAAPTMEEIPTIINGTSNGTNGHAAVEPEPVTDVTAGEDPKTYDDLFPSLPAGKPTGGSGGGNPLGKWNRKPKVASTTVTQVFVIPMEAAPVAGNTVESERKVVIKNADMSEEMQRVHKLGDRKVKDAVVEATKAQEKYNIERDTVNAVTKPPRALRPLRNRRLNYE